MRAILEMLSWLFTYPLSAPNSALYTLFRNFYFPYSFVSWLPVSFCKQEVLKECWEKRRGENEPPSRFYCSCQLPSHSFGSDLYLLLAFPEAASPCLLRYASWGPSNNPSESLCWPAEAPASAGQYSSSSGLGLDSVGSLHHAPRFCHL